MQTVWNDYATIVLWSDCGDDSWPQYATEHGYLDLALHAVALLPNGDAVATEQAWRDYQLANAANDRNGTYNVESIDIQPDGMHYQWEYCGEPWPCAANDPAISDYWVLFPRVELTAPDGAALYIFPGPWIHYEATQS